MIEHQIVQIYSTGCGPLTRVEGRLCLSVYCNCAASLLHTRRTRTHTHTQDQPSGKNLTILSQQQQQHRRSKFEEVF